MIRQGVWAIAMVWPSFALCAVHTVTQETYYETFSANHTPVKRVHPGDTIRTKTLDAAGGDERGSIHGLGKGNPLSGPFYLEGAEEGDALVVHFTRMRMNRNWGWTGWRLGTFSLPHGHPEAARPAPYKANLVHAGQDSQVPWDLDPTTNTVRLREPVSKAVNFRFPARPMLGCVGVAAAGDSAPNTGISGPYGGNMDYNEVAEGATLILPIYHAGGLFFLGDGHALQGDGEPMGTGIETSFDVEFTMNVRKHAGLTCPRLETDKEIISVGSQPEFSSQLDQALRIANADMVHWLVADYGLEPWAAQVLIGIQGRYRIVTVAGSVALKIPKEYLPTKP